MKTLPAAAIPVGATVVLPGLRPGGPVELKIDSKENASPRPGLISWWDTEGVRYAVGAATMVEVLELPA